MVCSGNSEESCRARVWGEIMGSLVVLLAMAGNLPYPMRWRHGGFGQTFLKGHLVTAWATEQGEGRGGGREAWVWSQAPLRMEGA